MVDPGLAVDPVPGGHRVRTLCPRSALRGQEGGVPRPPPHLHAHEFQILAADSFEAGTTDGYAGGARRTRPHPPPSSHPPHPPPGGPAASAWKWHRAQRGVQVVTTIQNRTGEYGVSVHCWCEWGEPKAEAGGDSGIHRAGRICRRRLVPAATGDWAGSCYLIGIPRDLSYGSPTLSCAGSFTGRPRGSFRRGVTRYPASSCPADEQDPV